jgi:uncharacterized protein
MIKHRPHRTHVLAAAAAAALTGAVALPAAAQAHVTLQPKQAAAGAYVVEGVRVPNETDDAITTKVEVRFPAGFASASYQPTPGWTVKVRKVALDQPVQGAGGPVSEGVGTVTWTADAKADGIAPGEFRDFPLSVQIPGKAGDTLTFKALQTYDDGEVVRWIGAPDADRPAPTVSVVAAADADHGATSDTLAIVALIVGALGLLAGGTALARGRQTA